jgi:hypothetical protein
MGRVSRHPHPHKVFVRLTFGNRWQIFPIFVVFLWLKLIPKLDCAMKMYFKSSWSGFIVSTALIVALVTGCSGSGSDTFKIIPVTGKVTLKGQALADADVQFNAQGEAIPASYKGSAAKTDAQGNFEVISGTRKGMPPGKYKITVSKWVGPDGKPAVASEGMDLEQLKAMGSAIQAVPPEFNDFTTTTLEYTVPETGAAPPLNIDIK